MDDFGSPGNASDFPPARARMRLTSPMRLSAATRRGLLVTTGLLPVLFIVASYALWPGRVSWAELVVRSGGHRPINLVFRTGSPPGFAIAEGPGEESVQTSGPGNGDWVVVEDTVREPSEPRSLPNDGSPLLKLLAVTGAGHDVAAPLPAEPPQSVPESTVAKDGRLDPPAARLTLVLGADKRQERPPHDSPQGRPGVRDDPAPSGRSVTVAMRIVEATREGQPIEPRKDSQQPPTSPLSETVAGEEAAKRVAPEGREPGGQTAAEPIPRAIVGQRDSPTPIELIGLPPKPSAEASRVQVVRPTDQRTVEDPGHRLLTPRMQAPAGGHPLIVTLPTAKQDGKCQAAWVEKPGQTASHREDSPQPQPLRLDVAATLKRTTEDNKPESLRAPKQSAAAKPQRETTATAAVIRLIDQPPAEREKTREPASPMAAQLAQTQPAQSGAKQAGARATMPAAKEGKPRPPAFDPDDRPISALTVDIGTAKGDLPPDMAQAKLAAMRDRPYNALADREWMAVWYLWEAPAMCHQPLYFEEVNLERYGYRWPHSSVFQPVLSCAQFYATLPLLPYKMVGEPSQEDIYTLGYYRPGSPAPYQVHFPRWRLGAGAGEAAVVAGLILLIP